MSLRVLILSENKPTGFSGGRYHVLMMAMALSHQGHHVVYQSTNLPAFLADFEGHSGRSGIEFQIVDRFARLVDQSFDIVILAPGRAFRSDLYFTARSAALQNGAELVLINFESANWYNSVSPSKRDPSEWSHWQEALSIGGTVLSSALESQKWAKRFYPKSCRHMVWSPPIHSKAANAGADVEREKRIALITRFDDAHKGADKIEAMLPEQARGYTLSLMTSSPVSKAMEETLADRLAILGVGLELIRSPYEVRKFSELKRAKAVLFPSRFEGYGLPPIEALFCGAEVACFDLPVIRETCGEAPCYAATTQVDALSQALGKALEMPDRSSALRAAIGKRADFELSSLQLSDLIRTCSTDIYTGVTRPGGALRIKAKSPSLLLRRLRALRSKQGRSRLKGRVRRMLNRLPEPIAQIEDVKRATNGILLISGFALGSDRPDRGEASIGGTKVSLEVGRARPDLLKSFPEYDEAYGGFLGEIFVPLAASEDAINVTLFHKGRVLHELESPISQSAL